MITDVYVYFFTVWNDSTKSRARFPYAGTLEAIEGRGVPIMESQLVVDRSELDLHGFLKSEEVDAVGGATLTSQIRSLELRAASRELAADMHNTKDDEQDNYVLRLESRELLKQARALAAVRADRPHFEEDKSGLADDAEPLGGTAAAWAQIHTDEAPAA